MIYVRSRLPRSTRACRLAAGVERLQIGHQRCDGLSLSFGAIKTVARARRGMQLALQLLSPAAIVWCCSVAAC